MLTTLEKYARELQQLLISTDKKDIKNKINNLDVSLGIPTVKYAAYHAPIKHKVYLKLNSILRQISDIQRRSTDIVPVIQARGKPGRNRRQISNIQRRSTDNIVPVIQAPVIQAPVRPVIIQAPVRKPGNRNIGYILPQLQPQRQPRIKAPLQITNEPEGLQLIGQPFSSEITAPDDIQIIDSELGLLNPRKGIKRQKPLVKKEKKRYYEVSVPVLVIAIHGNAPTFNYPSFSDYNNIFNFGIPDRNRPYYVKGGTSDDRVYYYEAKPFTFDIESDIKMDNDEIQAYVDDNTDKIYEYVQVLYVDMDNDHLNDYDSNFNDGLYERTIVVADPICTDPSYIDVTKNFDLANIRLLAVQYKRNYKWSSYSQKDLTKTCFPEWFLRKYNAYLTAKKNRSRLLTEDDINEFKYSDSLCGENFYFDDEVVNTGWSTKEIYACCQHYGVPVEAYNINGKLEYEYDPEKSEDLVVKSDGSSFYIDNIQVVKRKKGDPETKIAKKKNKKTIFKCAFVISDSHFYPIDSNKIVSFQKRTINKFCKVDFKKIIYKHVFNKVDYLKEKELDPTNLVYHVENPNKRFGADVLIDYMNFSIKIRNIFKNKVKPEKVINFIKDSNKLCRVFKLVLPYIQKDTIHADVILKKILAKKEVPAMKLNNHGQINAIKYDNIWYSYDDSESIYRDAKIKNMEDQFSVYMTPSIFGCQMATKLNVYNLLERVLNPEVKNIFDNMSVPVWPCKSFNDESDKWNPLFDKDFLELCSDSDRELINNSLNNSNQTAVDVIRNFSRAAEIDFFIYDSMCSPIEQNKIIHSGLYRVENCGKKFPYFGNNWYYSDFLNLVGLKGQITHYLPHTHKQNMRGVMDEFFGLENEKAYKNQLIGCLNKKKKNTGMDYFFTSDIYQWFAASTDKYKMRNIGQDKLCYKKREEAKYETTIPISRQIHFAAFKPVWELYKKFTTVHYIKTDCIIGEISQYELNNLDMTIYRIEDVKIPKRLTNKTYIYQQENPIKKKELPGVINCEHKTMDEWAEFVLNIFSNPATKKESFSLLSMAGSAKTFALTKLIERAEEEGLKILKLCACNAPAELIGAMTFDSAKIKLNNIQKINETDVIFITEAGLMEASHWDYVYKIKRIKPEIRIIQDGDFCQMPPVVDSMNERIRNYSELDAYKSMGVIIKQHTNFRNGMNYKTFVPEKTEGESMVHITYTNKLRKKINTEMMEKYKDKDSILLKCTKDDLLINERAQDVYIYDDLPSYAVKNVKQFKIKKYQLILWQNIPDYLQKRYHKYFMPGYAMTVYVAQGQTFDEKFFEKYNTVNMNYTIHEWNSIIMNDDILQRYRYTALSRCVKINQIIVPEYYIESENYESEKNILSNIEMDALKKEYFLEFNEDILVPNKINPSDKRCIIFYERWLKEKCTMSDQQDLFDQLKCTNEEMVVFTKKLSPSEKKAEAKALIEKLAKEKKTTKEIKQILNARYLYKIEMLDGKKCRVYPNNYIVTDDKYADEKYIEIIKLRKERKIKKNDPCNKPKPEVDDWGF